MVRSVRVKKALLVYCIIFSFICQVSSLFLLPTPVSADDTLNTTVTDPDNFYFKSFTADYYLHRNEEGVSVLDVKETLVAEFPEYDQNHGITRVIPFLNQEGKNVTTANTSHLKISAKRNGEPEKIYRTTSKDGAFYVQIGNPDTYVTGTQEYVLEYQFERVIIDFSSFQELYWDTNGNGWAQQFESLTANVHVDEELRPMMSSLSWCFVGEYGEDDTNRCSIEETEDGFSYHTESLMPGENLSFVIDFDVDTFSVPAPKKDYLKLILLICQILILILFSIYLLRYIKRYVSKKYQFYHKKFVAPEYQPKKGYTVAEMAEIYLPGTKNHNVATILELAVKHKITIIKDQHKNKRWSFKINSLEALTVPEINTLAILAKTENLKTDHTYTVGHSQYNRNLAKLLKQSAANIAKKLTRLGDLEPTNSPFAKRVSFAFVITVILNIVICIGINSYTSYYDVVANHFSAICSVILMVLSILSYLIIATAKKYDRRTTQGLELSLYMQGLKTYIKMAEKDRIKFLQSVDKVDVSKSGLVKLSEKLLPYACLFGLEKTWLKELQKYYEDTSESQPSWYSGVGILSAHDLHTFSNTISSSIASTVTTASSSSSGSGGSGFSGGGGGGGGGGGW